MPISDLATKPLNIRRRIALWIYPELTIEIEAEVLEKVRRKQFDQLNSQLGNVVKDCDSAIEKLKVWQSAE